MLKSEKKSLGEVQKLKMKLSSSQGVSLVLTFDNKNTAKLYSDALV